MVPPARTWDGKTPSTILTSATDHVCHGVQEQLERQGVAKDDHAPRLRICQKDGQIRTLTGERRDVASESKDWRWYQVSFAREGPTCECAYHVHGRGRGCKHIAAVEQLLLISSETAPGKRIVIKEREIMCPDCKKQNYKRNGVYHGKYEDRQKYKCRECGRGFRDNLGFEYRRVPSVYITMVLILSGAGSPVAAILLTLEHFKIKVHPDTVTRILEHHSGMAEGYANALKPPRLGEKWGCDEKHQKVCGRDSWFVAVMDPVTRFMLSRDTTSSKEKYDAAPLLQAARDMAGKVPRLFVTDGLAQYGIAFNKVYLPAKGPGCRHIRDIHIQNKVCNTNTQERLNGELADRFRSAHGINSEDSLIFRIVVFHHNFVKPHEGIGGKTPAEAAGIDVQGADKSRTLIQNAAAAA